MSENKVDDLLNNLSNLLDEIGLYTVKNEPSVILRKKLPQGSHLLESMIRGDATLQVEMECFVGEKAWNLSDSSFISPKIEMLLMTDLDFFSFLMNLVETKEGEDLEAEHSES